jgi:hypothetical protein
VKKKKKEHDDGLKGMLAFLLKFKESPAYDELPESEKKELLLRERAYSGDTEALIRLTDKLGLGGTQEDVDDLFPESHRKDYGL